MPISTFTPVSGANSPCDGYVGDETANEAFTTKRDGAGTGAATTNGTDSSGIFADTSSDLYDFLYHLYFNFDTSSIPDGDVIKSATITFYVNSKTNGLGSQPFHIAGATPAATNTLATSDFLNVGRTSFGELAYASITTSANNVWTLNANGLANISKTTISSFSLQVDCDLTGVAPTWASAATTTINVNMADAGSNLPTLTVTHEPEQSGFIFIST